MRTCNVNIVFFSFSSGGQLIHSSTTVLAPLVARHLFNVLVRFD